MKDYPLVSIAAGSELLQIGLERVVARAGLGLAPPDNPGTIRLSAELPTDSRHQRTGRHPPDGFLAELVVVGDEVEVRLPRPTSSDVEQAVARLIEQLSR